VFLVLVRSVDEPLTWTKQGDPAVGRRGRADGMILKHGNILDDDSDAIVIPVNCVGVMGKGLALAAKKRWPELALRHKADCAMPGRHRLEPGEIRGSTLVLNPGEERRMVWFAATKDHWRAPSRIEWVEECCKNLANFYSGGVSDYYRRQGVPMLAVPALGCGCGELSWADVLPIMERHFADIDVRVYVPLVDS
jgi:O-acetyl-ADP-ribose deacetylase (regulator of RNase III)